MRCPRAVVPATLAVGFLAGTLMAEPSARPYDVLSYRWAVTVGFEESPGPDSPYRSLFSPINTLDAGVVIAIRNVSDQPQQGVSLILHRLMNASVVESDGTSLTFRQELRALDDWPTFHVHHLTVQWPDPLAPGAEATLEIRYSGQLVGYPESGMLYVRETLDPEFTILRYETFCYPQVAEPTRDAVLAARRFDPFDQRVDVTVPESHVAITTGDSAGVKEADGQKTYSFVSREPSGFFMVPIAPYEVVTSGRNRIFHFPQSAEGVANLKVLLERVMALMTSWFGPAMVEGGLTIAEIPEGFGSQSGAFILQTSGAFNNPEQYGEFYHELSHLWNPRDVDAKPSRWNEGLAIFLEGVVEEHLGEEGRVDERLGRIYTRVREAVAKEEKLSTVAMIDYGREDMTSRSYSVGALMFGLLRHRVGEEALLGFVRDYSQGHRDSGSRDRAFAEEIVKALGNDASAIVDDWLLTPGFAEKVAAAETWDELKAAY